MRTHRCYACREHDSQGPFRIGSEGEGPELETLETTFTEDGDRPFFGSGYSAREIAESRAAESGGTVYVNDVSARIQRPDLGTRVEYCVSKSPVYTLRPPDALHEKVYRAYWRPLRGARG